MRSRVRSLLICLLYSATTVADPIAIPNFSFENPPVTRDGLNPFGALPYIQDWDETRVGLADELDQDTGNFINTNPDQPDHITNLHLVRAAFVSSLTGNTVRQELSQDYLVDRVYSFTIAVGKSYTFPAGDTEQLEVALFYFDRGTERIIASTLVSGVEVSATEVTDFTVTSAIVEAGDLWTGQPIGVLVRPSTTDPDDEEGEGFWNLDYARLVESPPPNADGDGDGDVDLQDFAMFQNCLSNRPEVGSACFTFDLNADLVLDLDDFGLFVVEVDELLGG